MIHHFFYQEILSFSKPQNDWPLEDETPLDFAIPLPLATWQKSCGHSPCTWPNHFFCGLGHAMLLNWEKLICDPGMHTRKTYQWQKLLLRKWPCPGRLMWWIWKRHPSWESQLSVMGNLHNWSGNYSEISKQTSPPVSFGKCFSMVFALCSLSWGRGTASTMCSSCGRFE